MLAVELRGSALEERPFFLPINSSDLLQQKRVEVDKNQKGSASNHCIALLIPDSCDGYQTWTIFEHDLRLQCTPFMENLPSMIGFTAQGPVHSFRLRHLDGFRSFMT